MINLFRPRALGNFASPSSSARQRFTNPLCLATLSLLLGALGTQPRPAFAQSPQGASGAAVHSAATLRDGAHDFDFGIGVWHTHIKRVLDPLSGATKIMEMDGTVTTRKVWDGRAQLEEIEADGPNGHWEGLTLFLYNPASHQWSQSYLNSQTPSLSSPLIGSFQNGRGELFNQDTFHDKSVLVRGVWSNITPDAHHFEEDYSNDGGKTWAPAFIAELTREKQVAAVDHKLLRTSASPSNTDRQSVAADDPQHAFDFDFGTWKTHSTRLLHPLTSSKTWVDMDGVSVVKKVWGGKANLAEYKADGPAGHIELMALRWFNPATHEWNLDFATPNVGTLGIPGVGEFKDGRCTFYDYELINGKSVLVRFSIWGITPNTARSEQAFSGDGGKTWEVNWINEYTRLTAE